MINFGNNSIVIKNSHSIAVLYVMLYIVFPNTTNAQIQYNLVPNYSFEQYTNCPSSSSMQEVRNSKPDYWYKPDRRNAIYYNACANGFNSNYTGVPINAGTHGYNFQYARTGNGYVGMYYRGSSDIRNYIQVELLDSLQQGKCYYAEYYVNLVNTSVSACNNQAMLFTNNPVYVDTLNGFYVLSANPQIQNTHIISDTLNWVKVSGVFTAQGGEKFLTLGNFKNNTQTATQQINPTGSPPFYYIEDVSVLPLDSITLKADAGIDKTIAAGDNVFIGSYTTGLTNVTWYNSTGNAIATNTAGFYVQPASSTFYVIEQNVCGQYSKDTVYITVGVVPLVIKNYELRVKNGGVVNKWLTLNEINVSHFNIQRSSNGIEFNTIQTVAAKNKSYNEYTAVDENPPLEGREAYYRVEAVDKDGKITYSKILSITSNHRPQTLNIYPNPTTGIVNIIFPEIKQVSIIDAMGRVVLHKQQNNINSVQLNVAGVGKGIFFVKVTDKKGNIQTQKLMIQ